MHNIVTELRLDSKLHGVRRNLSRPEDGALECAAQLETGRRRIHNYCTSGCISLVVISPTINYSGMMSYTGKKLDMFLPTTGYIASHTNSY